MVQNEHSAVWDDRELVESRWYSVKETTGEFQSEKYPDIILVCKDHCFWWKMNKGTRMEAIQHSEVQGR